MTTRNIGELKRLSELKKQLFSDSLSDKLVNEDLQTNLTRIYKPILSGQTEQLTETKKLIPEIIKTNENRDKNTDTIIEQQRIRQEVVDNYIVDIAKIARKYPNIVDIVKGINIDKNNLDKDEIKILNELNTIEDDKLAALVDLIILSKEPTHITIKDIESEYESLNDEPLKVELDPFEEHPLNSFDPKSIPTLSTLSELAEYYKVGETIYDAVYVNNPYKPNVNEEYLDEILQGNDSNYNKPNLTILIDYIKHHNLGFDKRLKINKYINEKYIKDKIGSGLTQFLTSNPQELIKKLDILIAENSAGNNNIFSEASAIIDELRRQGILTINQIRKIYNLIRNK